MSKESSVTAAFQQHLAQRRANIMNMFTNPQDALGEVEKAEDAEELDEQEDDKKVKKGCGDGDKTIEKEKDNADAEETEEETEEEDEDGKTDAEKAEIIDLIGIEQLDTWKAQIDELALNDEMPEDEKQVAVKAIEDEINDVIHQAANQYASQFGGTADVNVPRGAYDNDGEITVSIHLDDRTNDFHIDADDILGPATSRNKKSDCVKYLVNWMKTNLAV